MNSAKGPLLPVDIYRAVRRPKWIVCLFFQTPLRFFATLTERHNSPENSLSLSLPLYSCTKSITVIETRGSRCIDNEVNILLKRDKAVSRTERIQIVANYTTVYAYVCIFPHECFHTLVQRVNCTFSGVFRDQDRYRSDCTRVKGNPFARAMTITTTSGQ